MLKSKVNLTIERNHKLNTQNSIKDIIINKKFVIEDRKKIFQTQSNIKTFKLEVPRYRLRCHTLVELNGFDKFELLG